jgi:hypothetical protein
LNAGWRRRNEKRGEETRGWDSWSPDAAAEGNYEAPKRQNASNSMPDGVTGLRMGSRDAGWTHRTPDGVEEAPYKRKTLYLFRSERLHDVHANGAAGWNVARGQSGEDEQQRGS